MTSMVSSPGSTRHAYDGSSGCYRGLDSETVSVVYGTSERRGGVFVQLWIAGGALDPGHEFDLPTPTPPCPLFCGGVGGVRKSIG